LAAAALELDRMPSRDRRKVMALYGRLIRYRPQRPARRSTKAKEPANV
jgi:hypothetical protein